ncbi:MAG: tetratricopeptide repeat protein [Planctomycetota bacterium]
MRGSDLVKCGQPALGLELLQMAAGMDPRSISIQMALGDAYLEVGDLFSAETAFRAAACDADLLIMPGVREHRGPDAARDAIRRLAMKKLYLVLVLSGQWGEDGVEVNDPAIHLDPGWISVSSGDAFGRTIARLSEVREDPNRYFDPLGDMREKHDEVRRRRQLEPLPGSMAAADRSFFAGKYQEAIEQLSRILDAAEAARIEFEPFLLRHVTGHALGKRGRASMAQGHWDLARADFETACRLRPLDATAIVDRGLASFALNHDDNALADFNASLALDPDHFTARFCRGRALWKLKRLEEALLDFSATLSRAVSSTTPSAELILTDRAFLLHQMGQLAEAEADFRRAFRNRDTASLSEEARLNFAYLLWDLTRFEESFGVLKLLQESKSTVLRKHVWLGMALCELRLGHEEEALAWWRKALQAAPSLLTDFSALEREEGAWLSTVERAAVAELARKAAR